MDKKNIRVFFEKKDRAIYISHLDLLRTMQRALKRSGLPVWYSEGFNPRIYLNFPLALALGVESSCEIMDFPLIDNQLRGGARSWHYFCISFIVRGRYGYGK